MKKKFRPGECFQVRPSQRHRPAKRWGIIVTDDVVLVIRDTRAGYEISRTRKVPKYAMPLDINSDIPDTVSVALASVLLTLGV